MGGGGGGDGGQDQNWPTSAQMGCKTPTAWGVPNTSDRGIQQEVAHKWMGWLPCRVGGGGGGGQRVRAGDTISNGPPVGGLAT